MRVRGLFTSQAECIRLGREAIEGGDERAEATLAVAQ